MTLPPWINEEFTAAAQIPPGDMDALWAAGWRHFGRYFFRYSLTLGTDGGLDIIVPLRIDLAHFTPSKSQRRVQRRNEDVQWEIRPAEFTPDLCDLFEKHKQRFTSNVPESLAVFLGDDPRRGPCACLEFRCLLRGRLIASSLLDVGARSVSAVYAVFDPAESRRSPGILTLLKEIEWARAQGFAHHLPGYSTVGAGVYEYKKQFGALEGYAWAEEQWKPWHDFAASLVSQRLDRIE